MATNNSNNFSNPIGVVNGGTGVASLVAYEPLLGGTTSTGPIQQNAQGFSTSGNVLKSMGASALPIFSTYAPFVLLSSQTVVAAATLDFDNTIITSAYTNYFLVYRNISHTLGGNMLLTFSTNNGSTFVITGYQSGRSQTGYNTTTTTNATSTTSILPIGSGTGNGVINSGQAFMNIPQGGMISYVGKSLFQSSPFRMTCYGTNSSTTTANFLRFTPSLGVITGTIAIYGIKS